MFTFGTPAQDAKFLAACLAGNQTMALAIQVWHGNTLLETIAAACTSGSVTVTETASVRRTCTFTLQSQGWPLDNLVPRKAGDLLHPGSGNQLRIFRGFKYPNGQTALAPLGRFNPSTPKVTDTDDAITIAVGGKDPSARLARLAYLTPYTIYATTTAVAAIKAILQTRTPLLTTAFLNLSTGRPAGSLYKVTAITLGATPANGTNNPWQYLTTLATDAGCELYFDPSGIVVMRPIPTPLTELPILTFTTGENSVITGQITRPFTGTTEFSGVTALGQGPGGPPVRYEIWTRTPTSPTYTTGPFGKIPKVYVTDLIPALTQSATSAQAQIQEIAEKQFSISVTALSNPTFKCTPNPMLWEGDVVQLVRPKLGLNTKFVVSGLVIPLMAGTSMTVKLRGPQRTVLA